MENSLWRHNEIDSLWHHNDEFPILDTKNFQEPPSFALVTKQILRNLWRKQRSHKKGRWWMMDKVHQFKPHSHSFMTQWCMTQSDNTIKQHQPHTHDTITHMMQSNNTITMDCCHATQEEEVWCYWQKNCFSWSSKEDDSRPTVWLELFWQHEQKSSSNQKEIENFDDVLKIVAYKIEEAAFER